MSTILQNALVCCVEHREIFPEDMMQIMRSMMQGELSDLQISALLLGLRVKKETISEISAAAQVMREFAVPVAAPSTPHLIDIVGTGGDGASSFNISTAAMFVVAAAGAIVAKHGNRSVSSPSGSADVLEALGANIMLSPHHIAECMKATNIGFMFAPNHHPAMRHVAAVRNALGIRTLFNILGPLTNPARAPNVLMGVFHEDLVGIQVRVLQCLGTQRALVVYGCDGLDEISLSAATRVGELRDGHIIEYTLHPSDFDLHTAHLHDLKVDNPQASRLMLQRALQPEQNTPHPAHEVVCLNAGAALYIADLAPTISAGIALARATIASGAAHTKLHQFIKFTQICAAQADLP